MTNLRTVPSNQPLQWWQGLLCRPAKVGAIQNAKVGVQSAKVIVPRGKGRFARWQGTFVRSAKEVVQIGLTVQVSSMSVIKRSLFNECHQEVSSGRSPCLPSQEGSR
jgi:hypothetical protein